jgi:hypothetical protein
MVYRGIQEQMARAQMVASFSVAESGKEKISGWAGGDSFDTSERSRRVSSAAGLAAEPRFESHRAKEMRFYPDSERASTRQGHPICKL